MNLLTIVIPTYNRSSLLKSTLDTLSIQIMPERFNEIAIVVSDNASPDSTEILVHKWIIENKNIKVSYYRNIENIGFDKNCISGARKAKGKFIWFMSDDDSLVDGAVEKVCKALEENSEIVFAFINYSMLTPGFDEYFPYRFQENIKLAADELIIKSKMGFSFISSCVFNREIFCSLDLSNYLETFWLQLYAAKNAALKGESLIIAEPLLKMHRGGLHESRKERKDQRLKVDAFMVSHLCYLDFLDSFKNSLYSNETYKSIKDFGWNDNLNQIISLKLTSDRYSLEEIKIIYSKMRKYYSRKVLFWIFHVPMLLLPKFASIIYFFLKLKFIKLKKVLKPIVVWQRKLCS
ncbi:MAG: Abequosyltransferase RfbV [Nitrosomonadaceae bacterium]|nr:Abequosyltransferase RfbV [Nitrosomonadaceae bacterium]